MVYMHDESNGKLHFRTATDADRPRLIEMINAAFAVETFLEGTRTDEERLTETMEEGEVLVAEDKSTRILASVYTELRGKRGYMGMLAVDPAHQRAGLGSRMLEAAEEHFRAKGCDAIDITVLSLRPELPPIYRRLGFVETGIEAFHPSQPLKAGLECHCIVMSKTL
jgi:ribosomal protein S18 acetylase RimI-like enzyme